MDHFLLSLFKVELESQCELADTASKQLNKALKHDQSEEQIWMALQCILLSAANASKLLWGSGGRENQKKIEAKRKPLRELAGVSGNSPLKSRRVRDAFEHFDEHIEKQAKKIKVFAPRHIGEDEIWPPKNGRFGYFNPTTEIVEFLNRSVSIRDLLTELARIKATLSR